MHSNKIGLSTLVLGAVLSSAVLAGFSAKAATLSNVSVSEGYGYTNLTLQVTSDEATTATITIADVLSPATAIKTISDVAIASGANAITLDVTGTGLATGKTYAYTVTPAAGDAKTVTFSNVGWLAGKFFDASAATGESVVNGGAWETVPEISDNKYQIEGEAVTFDLNDAAKGKVDDSHQIIDFQCDAAISSYYLLDDITNDVTGAIGAMSLVTNESNNTAYWMVLKDGTEWVEATAGDGQTLLASYALRMEVDYAAKADASSAATIRYSVKKSGETDWTALTVSGSEWVAATNATANVAKIAFAGKSEVAKFDGGLSTKNIAVANGTEYGTVQLMLDGAGDNTITLFTNVKINPCELTYSSGTSWTFDGAKNVAVVNPSFVAPATLGKTATYAANTLTLTDVALVAEIGDVFGTAGNPRYTTLAAAIAALNANQTLSLIGDQTGNLEFEDNPGYVLNLNGVTLTPASADSPIVKVTGSLTTLVITNGTISGATSAAAVSADAGDITIGEGAVVASSTTATAVANEGEIILDGGAFENAGTVAGVTVNGGYILGNTTFSSMTAKAGKFDSTAKDGCAAADNFKFVDLNETFTKDSFTVAYEIMTNISGTATADSKVYTVDSTTKATVQLPNDFVAKVTSETGAAAQEALNEDCVYDGGTKKAKKWECYVLGMEDAVSGETTTKGPWVKSVSGDSSNIKFSLLTPAAIKAAEAGCDVTYQVQSFSDPECTKSAGNSETVDYTQNATIANPSAARYYKLKVFVSTKQ